MEDLYGMYRVFHSSRHGQHAELAVDPACQGAKVIMHGNFLLTRNRHFRINVGTVAHLILGQMSATGFCLPSRAFRAP